MWAEEFQGSEVGRLSEEEGTLYNELLQGAIS